MCIRDRTTSAGDVSLASSISPIAGIVFAFIILGEAPTIAHYIGGSIIVLGIIFNQLGAARLNKPVDFKEMDKEVGFKGV